MIHDPMGDYITLQCGEGTPLVMLHGMMGQASNWEGLFPYLPPTCRAVALHFPFFRAQHELESVPGVADYAAGYLQQARFERFALCGNSLGGHVALELALRMPRRVCGLVLTASSGLFERSFGAVPPMRPPRDWVRRKIEEVFHDPAYVTDGLVDEVIAVISDRRRARALVRIAKSAKRSSVSARLKDVACPTLLIWGRQDRITPPEVAEEFRRGIPDAEVVWLDRCGHAPMMEHPREFALALGDWWNRRIACEGGAPVRKASGAGR